MASLVNSSTAFCSSKSELREVRRLTHFGFGPSSSVSCKGFRRVAKANPIVCNAVSVQPPTAIEGLKIAEDVSQVKFWLWVFVFLCHSEVGFLGSSVMLIWVFVLYLVIWLMCVFFGCCCFWSFNYWFFAMNAPNYGIWRWNDVWLSLFVCEVKMMAIVVLPDYKFSRGGGGLWESNLEWNCESLHNPIGFLGPRPRNWYLFLLHFQSGLSFFPFSFYFHWFFGEGGFPQSKR